MDLERENQIGSVNKVLACGANDWDLIPDKVETVILLPTSHINSGDRKTSYPIGSGFFPPTVTWPGRHSDHSPLHVSEVRLKCLSMSSSYME
jgi:hypothetical protein